MNESTVFTNMVCPYCGQTNVTAQLFQETSGTTKVSRTKSRYRSGHGVLWWIFIGWWWWIVDLFLWIFLFIPRLLIKIFSPKKVRGKSTTVEQSINQISYKTVCLCNNCGRSWVKPEPDSGLMQDKKMQNKKIRKDIKNLKRTIR